MNKYDFMKKKIDEGGNNLNSWGKSTLLDWEYAYNQRYINEGILDKFKLNTKQKRHRIEVLEGREYIEKLLEEMK